MALAHSTKIATSGLILYYDPANSKSYPGSGTSWSDISGNNVTGTMSNVTYSSTNNGIMTFNGSNSVVSLTRPSQITVGIYLTVSIWAKWTTNTGGTSVIQTLIDNNHSVGAGFVIQDRPDLGKTLTWSAQVSVAGAQSTIIVGDGNWHNITGTSDGSYAKLYIDGVFNAQAAELAIQNPQPTVTIGRWQGGARWLNGSIGPVQIYNRVLSDTEIKQNFNALRGRFSV